MNKDKGLLVVLSSPSGGGKTTVINKLKSEECDFQYSISMTTRPPRNGEQNGRDYWFVNEKEFQRKIKNDALIEFEKVHDWYYGTPRQPIIEWLEQGQVVLLDLDVFGALQLKNQFDSETLLIFIKPPNEQVLLKRLKNRSTESSAQISKRLERVPKEMDKAEEFDEIVINDDLNKTINKVKQLIKEKQTML